MHVRLSCKRLASIAAERLLEEVTVVPHQDSFEEILNLSDHATLGKHVKCLVYDTLIMLEADDILRRINADHPNRLRLCSFLKYHDERTFRTVKQTGQELQYFLRVFESLPSLKAIKIRNVKGLSTFVTDLPRFYELIGKQMDKYHLEYFSSMSKVTHRTHSFLLCAYVSGLKLEHLQVEDVKWEKLFSFAKVREESGYFNELSEILSARLAEKLAHKKEFHSGLDWMFVLSRAVSSVLNLKSLNLRFENTVFRREYREGQPLLLESGLLPCHLPRIQILQLERVTAIADDLVDFVLGSSAALTSLTIEHAILIGKADRLHTCWVSVIKRLQGGLRLEKACLDGVLSTGGKQYWLASPFDQLKMELNGKRSLKGQVEDLLVHGGQCPLDRAVVPGVLDGQPKQPLWRGDESFLLCNLTWHVDDDDEY